MSYTYSANQNIPHTTYIHTYIISIASNRTNISKPPNQRMSQTPRFQHLPTSSPPSYSFFLTLLLFISLAFLSSIFFSSSFILFYIILPLFFYILPLCSLFLFSFPSPILFSYSLFFLLSLSFLSIFYILYSMFYVLLIFFFPFLFFFPLSLSLCPWSSRTASSRVRGMAWMSTSLRFSWSLGHSPDALDAAVLSTGENEDSRYCAHYFVIETIDKIIEIVEIFGTSKLLEVYL